MYEELTKYIGKLKPGIWEDNPRSGDGSPEHPFIPPDIVYDKEVRSFTNAVFKAITFDISDYMGILERYFKTENINFNTIDISNIPGDIILVMFFTIIRRERFCDGLISAFIENGMFDKWLLRLKEIDEQSKTNLPNSTPTHSMLSILLGTAVGDALGMPFEFMQGGTFRCTGMAEYGTHHQPKGTWSDDTSLTLCLADAIGDGFTIGRLADNCLSWMQDAKYTAGGNVFDIGWTTRSALSKIADGEDPLTAGGSGERTNGNGSLMRIAPLALYTRDMDIGQRYELCRQVSSITHRHIVSVTACFILIELLRNITLGQDKATAYRNVINETMPYLNKITDNETMAKFDRLPTITTLNNNELKSGGYVIETIEASMWCFMNTQCYADAVLSAVNLGHDTDTTAAVTGAVAGLYYGTEGIPTEWIRDLKNKELIESIAKKWDDK